MFYHYLRFLNYVLTVFGIRKPFLTSTGTPTKMLLCDEIWSLIVLAGIVVAYTFTMISYSKLNLKNNLNIFYETNDMAINVLVIIMNLLNRKHLVKLYEGVETIVQDCKIRKINVKMISVKIYLVFTGPTMILMLLIILEKLKADSFLLIMSLPTYLTTFHLVLHLIFLLAILKLISLKMTELSTKDVQSNNFIEEVPKNIHKVKYLISPEIRFFKVDCKGHFDLKYFCRIYNDLCTCIQLLEQHHGTQMLITFWLMFTNAVFGITMIACNIAKYPELTVARSILPFIWCFFGSFINDQIDKQVEQIDMAIIKCLIDFKCDATRKVILQTFKQLIATNRLQFTACSLFRLNYSMILGTIVNVITYSIIMIQLFLSDA